MEKRRIISCSVNDSQQSQFLERNSNFVSQMNNMIGNNQLNNILQKSFSESREGQMPIVSAISWSIFDFHNGDLLWGKQAQEKKEMASLTKIMTLFTTLEICRKFSIDLETLVVVPRSAVLICGTSAFLYQGDQLTLKDLLYGLMLPSGNDAALVLSNFLGSQLHPQRRVQSASGSNSQIFINYMNKLATKIGLKHSNFSNPHGLSEKSNKSTAQDLGKLSVYILKNFPICQKIASTQTYQCSVIMHNQKTRSLVWVNTNVLLNTPGFYGLKTGWTPNAGYCLVGLYEVGGIKLVITVLQSKCNEKRFLETKKLAFWAERSLNIVQNSFNSQSPLRLRNTQHQSQTSQSHSSRQKQQYVKAKLLAQISNQQ